jgi:pyruvate/2-oxoglutarate dehydrogenase complex dihydrolipoamide acyltransferase (E2) component
VSIEVIMPKVGMYEDDVTLAEWLIEDGAMVHPGDPVFTMETEKVETEIEAEDAGILVQGAAVGFSAPVGTRIGWLATSVEEAQALKEITAT